MQGAEGAEVIQFERGGASREETEEAVRLWRRTRATAEVLSREEVGAMDWKRRMDAQRKALILALVEYYRNHERADVAPGVLAIITILSDNDRGCATISQPTLARMLGRSESSIRDAQKRLKDDGLIIMGRGRFAGTSPVIPRFVADHYNHVAWMVGALSEADKPLNLPAPQADCQSGRLPGGLNNTAYGSGGMKLLNPPDEDVSIRRGGARQVLSTNSEEEDSPRGASVARIAVAIAAGAVAMATPLAAEPHPTEQVAESTAECWQTPKAQMAAAMSAAEARAQKQIWVTATGLVEAAGEFRAELEREYPLVDLKCGLAASAPNVKPDRGVIDCMQAVRRQFGFMQQDAKRREAKAPPGRPRVAPWEEDEIRRSRQADEAIERLKKKYGEM
jgi:hypothetical protein